MILQLSVLAQDESTAEAWARELSEPLRDIPGVTVDAVRAGNSLGQMIFLDGSSDAALQNLDKLLRKIDRKGRAIVLILANGARVPQALVDGRVDDVLVHPFRKTEILGKIHHYRQIMMWNEVSIINQSFTDLIQKLQNDLKLAERLQKGKLPIRFPEVKGFKVITRYLAGLRSGGDHLDLADAKDSTQVSLLLSDSSSYGLSSNVLSVLMRVAMKLSSQESRSSVETVRRIHEELSLTLGEKDRLSLFYGVVSRRDLTLRYLNLGTSLAFHSRAGRPFAVLPNQGDTITKKTSDLGIQEAELVLAPEDRLALVSDGFTEAVGGADALCELLDRFRGQDPTDSINEMVFKVKSKLIEADDMPEQDCTAAIFDVNANLLRLAKR